MRNHSRGQSPDRHDWLARAAEALAKARLMKPGAERNDALKTPASSKTQPTSWAI